MLSIARISPKKYITNKEKFVRYKIGIKSYFNPKTKEYSYKRPIYLFCDDWGNSLSFYTFINSGGKGVKGVQKINQKVIFSIKNGKLNIFSKNKSTIRNISARILAADGMERISSKYHFFTKKQHNKRIKSIVFNFLRRNGFKVKNKKEKQNWEKEVTKICYPALKYVDFNRSVLSGVYSRYFRQPTLKQAIKKGFGNSGKRITRAVCEYYEKNKNFDIFILGYLLKGLLPFDHIIKLIEENKFPDNIKGLSETNKYKTLRKLLKNYSKERILILIENCVPFLNGHLLSDTINMYSQIQNFKNCNISLPESPKHFGEIHDYLSKQFHKIKNPEFDLDIIKNEKWAVIDNCLIDNLQVYIPKTNYDLIEMGEVLKNCLGSYPHQVKEGHVKILILKENNNPKYAISVKNKEINQFYGYRNTVPDENDRKKVIDFLQKNGIIKTYIEQIMEPVIQQNQNVLVNLLLNREATEEALDW